ncbi:MAG TPA: peptidoglycan DD-metalloendopeptidase family protein [Chloroflexota bacterium]|nr:peptidoglycan DD-metalloendopeptidase family protein [Chloroflexota bacterium]
MPSEPTMSSRSATPAKPTPAGRTVPGFGRRAALGAGAAALIACTEAGRSAVVVSTDPPPAAPVEQDDAPVAVVVPPAKAPPPAPQPVIADLGAEGVVQPVWSGEGDRVLFYSQPRPGQGGTWSVSPGGAPLRERPQWGYYVATGTLLVAPRPSQRDTYVLHLPSGREWTLPTTNSTLFSADGTLVAYGAATQSGGGGFGNFQTSTLVVAGADGQYATRIPLPINASPVVWAPGKDGSPNGRILLTGRRSRADQPALWLLDVRDRSLADFGRSKRLVGALPSPDGTWVAYVAMWNQDAAQNGLWVTRTDGTAARRLDFVGSYRWTRENRLIVIPVRQSARDSHEVWEVDPTTGTRRRLTDPAQTPFRIANFDWDLSPDGTNLAFVSADTRRLTNLALPAGLPGRTEATIAPPPTPGGAGGGKPYRMPFDFAPGPSGWYIAHWYGVTTGGYRGRNSVYSQGQGIHFGIDFPAPMGTPLVAVAPGRVIAVDGDYGSPPHNVVIQMEDGNQAMYGHLIERSRHVRVGQLVEAGQVVANTGDSSNPYDGNGNPHVHLEIRKGGRAVATNPVPYVDFNWDDLGLGLYPGPRFERDLDNPTRHQFPDDQPDIRFGGAIITNFARAWPP